MPTPLTCNADHETDTAAERLAYSPDHAAEIADLGRTSIFRALARGELPSLKVGRRRLILREDLHAWLHSKREMR